MDKDRYLSLGERETPIPSTSTTKAAGTTVKSAAKLVKVKKCGTDAKLVKKPRVAPAASQDARALRAEIAPAEQGIPKPKEARTGMNLPIVQLIQYNPDKQPAEGEQLGTDDARCEEMNLQPGNPFQLTFPPEFFDMFRDTMREEIFSVLDEGGFRPSNPPNSFVPSYGEGRDSDTTHNTENQKRPREESHGAGRDEQEDALSDKEDGEFLSGEEEIDRHSTTNPCSMFFQG